MSQPRRLYKIFPGFFLILASFGFISFPVSSLAAVDVIKIPQEKREYMTSNERLKTEAVQLFIDRRYEDALNEFKILERQYPKDVVIKRYIAACISPPPTSKKWSLYGQQGVEWQKNPTLTSREFRYARQRSESAVVFFSTLHGKYELLRKNAWTLHGSYRHYESIYTDTQDERNFSTNTANLIFTYDRLVKKRPFLAQFTSTFNHVLRHGVAHSKGLSQSVTLTYSSYEWNRMVLYDRWGPTWYEDDEEAPEHTSRDAVTNVIGLANYFFFNKEKNFFTLLRVEFGHDEADGVNEDRNRLTYSGVLHFPMPWGLQFPILRNTEGEVEFQFGDSQYPKWDYPFGETRRRDAEYIFRCRLTKDLQNHWMFHIFYTYLNNSSRYDQETFSNHTIGSSLSFYY